MAQAGYIQCGGCGRLFRENDPAQMAALETHPCSGADIVEALAKLDAKFTAGELSLDEYKRAKWELVN